MSGITNNHDDIRKLTESEWDLFKRISQTQFVGFSKQNYYEKIYKNQRKNFKITKMIKNFIFFFVQLVQEDNFCNFNMFPLIFINFLKIILF